MSPDYRPGEQDAGDHHPRTRTPPGWRPKRPKRTWADWTIDAAMASAVALAITYLVWSLA